MKETDETHIRLVTYTKEKNQPPISGFPFIMELSDALEGATVEGEVIRRLIYRLPVATLIRMEEELHKRKIEGVHLDKKEDMPIQILSLYLTHIGLPKWAELDGLGITQLRAESLKIDPEDPSLGEESPITSITSCFGQSNVRPKH